MSIVKNYASERCFENGIFPSDTQTLLIKACLSEEVKESKGAFDAWIKNLTLPHAEQWPEDGLGLPQFFDSLDLASQRLLSLLYKKQVEANNHHPIIKQLEGYYKYIWYRNHIFIAELDQLSNTLSKNGIEVIARKGVYQTLAIYEDYGLRPMVDLDVTVHEDAWNDAVSLIKGLGWKSVQRANPYRMKLAQIPAHAFRRGEVELDMHYGFSNYYLTKETKINTWRTLSRQGNYSFLAPAYEQYLALLHGFEPNTIAPIRWIIDATLSFQKFSTTDWEAFAQLVNQEKKKSIATMLNYLINQNLMKSSAALESHIEEMKNLNYNLIERLQLRTKARNYTNGFLQFKKTFYFTLLASGSLTQTFTKIAKNYLYAWNLRFYIQLPLYAIVIALDKSVFPKRKRPFFKVKY